MGQGLEKVLSTLDLKNAAAIIIETAPEYMARSDIDTLVTGLMAIQGFPQIPILVVQNREAIKTLSETEMNALGWVRKDG